MTQLTPQRLRLLRFITNYHAEHNHPPTLAVAAKFLGITSSATIHKHVSALRTLGLLEYKPHAKGAGTPTGLNPGPITPQSIAEQLQAQVRGLWISPQQALDTLDRAKAILQNSTPKHPGTTQNHKPPVFTPNDGEKTQ